jgi:hypothetical protein
MFRGLSEGEMTEAQQAQQLEEMEAEAAQEDTNRGFLVLGVCVALIVVLCLMYAWKNGGKKKKDEKTIVNPLQDSRKSRFSVRLSNMFTSSKGARTSELVNATEHLDAYVLDTKNLPKNHMMKSNWTYYQDERATDKMEDTGALAFTMDVEMLYKDHAKVDKGTLVEFHADGQPIQAMSSLPLPPCLLLCVEMTILDFYNGELSFGLSFAPQVKGAWPGGFKGTVGYRSQGVINNGTTKSWIRSKCGGFAAGDVITIMINREFNDRTLHKRARLMNPEAASSMGGTPMSQTPKSQRSPAHGSNKEWDIDNLPPRGFGALLFLKNGIPCQDMPIIMPELRMPKLAKEFMPTIREGNRNSMVSGEHDVDTPWADLPALFISIACDSKAKVDINLGHREQWLRFVRSISSRRRREVQIGAPPPKVEYEKLI